MASEPIDKSGKPYSRISYTRVPIDALLSVSYNKDWTLFKRGIMNPFVFGAIVFVAAFTKGLAGFGQALVAVPLLVSVIGLQITSPVMSLFGLTSNIYLLIRNRRGLDFREIWRLSLASLLMVPLGVWGLSALDEHIVLAILGAFLIAYSLYALIGPRLPYIKEVNLGFIFGAFSGLLTGAYNTGGPPIVIYGTCRQWNPTEFKGNIQAFFMMNSVVVVSSHFLSKNYTPDVLRYFALALPFLVAGMVIGSHMDKYLNPVQFRKLVLMLLVVLGATLIL
jgi:hypothetical protein